MSHFRAKEVFRQAQAAEKLGRKRTASSQYSSVAAYLRHKGNFREAKVILQRAIHLAPDSARLYLQLALCDHGLKDSDAAEAHISEFARRAFRKKQVELYRPHMESLLKNLPELRQVYFETLLEVDRTSGTAFVELGRVLIEQGKWDEAQQSLVDALKTKEMREEVFTLLRQVFTARDLKNALGHLERFEEGKMPLDDLLSLLKAPKSEKGVSPRPAPPPKNEEKDLQTLIHELEEEIGFSLEEKHDSVQPLLKEFRRKSEAILKNDAKARMDMGLAFFEMGLIEEACDEVKHVAATDPLYAEAQCLLGDILIEQGSYLGALECYQSALRDERTEARVRAEAKYKLIQVYFRLGDLAQAIRLAEELENLAPGYRDLRRLRVKLNESKQQAQGKGVEAETRGKSTRATKSGMKR